MNVWRKLTVFAVLLVCLLFTDCGRQQEPSVLPTVEGERGADDTTVTEAGKEADEAADGWETDEETDKELNGESNEEVNEKSVEDTDVELKKLQVLNGTLKDASGSSIQLKGISSHGLSWFGQYINETSISQMKNEWNMNVFRMAMYTAEENGYCVGDENNKEALKDIIHEGVTAAEEAGMYVIIDWHILSDNNPLMYVEEAKLFFAEMAEKYRDKTHIIYEICNEPNGDTSWQDIKQYADEVIPAIRDYSDAVILVGTPVWCQEIDMAAADPLSGYDNIMYTLHFYAATHKDALQSKLIQAVDSGLPVFVSEFGICDAAGSGIIDEAEANQWIDIMNEHNISYVMWNLSNKNESSAMIQSTVVKTSGFEKGDLTQSGLWAISNLRALPSDYRSEEKSTSRSTTTDKAVVYGQVEINKRQSWESNGSMYYLYDISFTNTSNRKLTDWQIEIVFNENVAITEAWNAFGYTGGKVMILSAADYNKAVAAGEVLEDIGMIVTSEKGLDIKEVSFDSEEEVPFDEIGW